MGLAIKMSIEEKTNKAVKSAIKFSNGYSAKLNNRRVSITSLEEDVVLSFRTITEIETPLTVHTRLKGKATQTDIRLNDDSAFILMLMLADYFKYETIKKQTE